MQFVPQRYLGESRKTSQKLSRSYFISKSEFTEKRQTIVSLIKICDHFAMMFKYITTKFLKKLQLNKIILMSKIKN